MNAFRDKIKQLSEQVKSEFIMINDSVNVYYFSGVMIRPHERMLALLINTNTKETALVYPALDDEIAKKSEAIDKFLPVSDGEDAFLKIFEFTNGITLGIEGEYVTYNRYSRLLEQFDAANIQPIDEALNLLRGIKNASDKEKLQEAVDMTEKALHDMVKLDLVGMTEGEIADFLVTQLKSYGAAAMSFGPIVLTGANSALPHGTPGDTKVQEGDFLLIDFGVVTKDYYVSDMTRTFIIGEPTEKQRDIYNAVLKANEVGVAEAKVGQVIGELDTIAREEIDTRGFGEYFNHRLGHGLGLGLHEGPSMDVSNKNTLEKGNVVTIEPGIYIPGYGGVRIEDMLYIDDETHVFTSFPKDLDAIVIPLSKEV